MVSEEEAAEIMDELSDIIDEELLKDMYASKSRKQFAQEILSDYFEDIAYSRRKIIVPESAEMLSATNILLDSIADKYKKIA